MRAGMLDFHLVDLFFRELVVFDFDAKLIGQVLQVLNDKPFPGKRLVLQQMRGEKDVTLYSASETVEDVLVPTNQTH